MKEQIIDKLHEIEQREQVRILLAVESGSRAWGFASPDSDYDVRFIYVRQQQDYLRLDSVRDVIELQPDEILDINGWDLQKTLRLLHKSNPTVFEWFSSPIIYMQTEFAQQFKQIMNDYFSKKPSLYHYINMADRNYREFLKTDMVKIKKYFYVLRPVLACQWILDKGTPPPMLFSELVKTELPETLQEQVDELLRLKMNTPEIQKIPKAEAINEYLDKSIQEIKELLSERVEKTETDWKRLNELFLQEVWKS